MTTSITDLVLRMVEDMPDRLHLLLQRSRAYSIENLPSGPKACVRLPVRIHFRKLPGNKSFSSAEVMQPFIFTSEEVQIIRARAEANQLSQEAALLELLKLSLQKHELLLEITRLVNRRFKHAQVTIKVELWGKAMWYEKRTN
jgi:hypothetical protein